MRKFILLFIFFSFGFLNAKEHSLSLVRLDLPNISDEHNYLVLVGFGANLMVDCNAHFLIGGKIFHESSKEFGEYIKFIGKNELVSTRMACYDKPKVKFIEYDVREILSYKDAKNIKILKPKDVLIKYEIYKKTDEKIIGE